jgi:glutathione S-transferase
LSAPLVVAPEYGVPLPQPEVMPPEMARLVEQARAHPAGRYALALFREHRRSVVVHGALDR